MKKQILYIVLLTGILTACSKPQTSLIAYDFSPEFPTSERYQVTVDGVNVVPLQTERGGILNFGMSGSGRGACGTR